MTHNNDTGLPPLSDREAQILSLLPYGLSDKEIGTKIGLNHNTVKTHLRIINRKWGTNGRVQLIVTAYQHGILTLPEAPVREAANGATNTRLWACIDLIRYEVGLPNLPNVDAETVLTSTLSSVRQLAQANEILSNNRGVRPLTGGVSRVG